MIPIYRAKRKDGDEYIQGLLCSDGCGFLHLTNYLPPMGYSSIKIDPSTLAIHFPDDTWRSIEEVQEALKYFDQHQKLTDGEY